MRGKNTGGLPLISRTIRAVRSSWYVLKTNQVEDGLYQRLEGHCHIAILCTLQQRHGPPFHIVVGLILANDAEAQAQMET